MTKSDLGTDIKRLWNRTLDECKYECNQELSCKRFSRKNGADTRKSSCWLKTEVGTSDMIQDSKYLKPKTS